jgi:hypothetical protein
LKLNDKSEPNDENDDPFITCAFVSKDILMITLFHNQSKTKTHHHFLFDCSLSKIVDKHVVKKQLNCTRKNFPVKSFYNAKTEKIYTFYKEGIIVTVDANNIDQYHIDELDFVDFG